MLRCRLFFRYEGFVMGFQLALAEIAEAFATVAFTSITCQDGAQFVDHFISFDRVFVQPIEARAGFIAAKIELVFIRTFAHESNFGHVWRAQPFGQPVIANDQFSFSKPSSASSPSI